MLFLTFSFYLIGLIVCLFILTQIIIPVRDGKKMFPLFRKSDLRTNVLTVEDEVSYLREQANNLQVLERLLKEKADLEKRIADIKSAVNPQENK